MNRVIEQRTITLPFLYDEVSALFLVDGKIYIPVYQVCQALGIRADRHIRLWQNLALWITAQKLPFRTERQGKRQVWCLPISHVPFLYSLFDWRLVSPERRLQLLTATEKQVVLADLAYQEMQWHYHAIRRALFTFLTTFADIDVLLQRYTHVISSTLENESSLTLVAHIERGRSLFKDATDQARKIMHDQGELPIIETFTIDADNNVIDTSSMPLLPIVSPEDSELFFSLVGQLTAWMRELQAIWSERE
jgi:hypothetical protein